MAFQLADWRDGWTILDEQGQEINPEDIVSESTENIADTIDAGEDRFDLARRVCNGTVSASSMVDEILKSCI